MSELEKMMHDLSRQMAIANEYCRDAERYRWLREKASRQFLTSSSKKRAGVIQVIQWVGRDEANVLTDKALDEAIDAAIDSNPAQTMCKPDSNAMESTGT